MEQQHQNGQTPKTESTANAHNESERPPRRTFVSGHRAQTQNRNRQRPYQNNNRSASVSPTATGSTTNTTTQTRPQFSRSANGRPNNNRQGQGTTTPATGTPHKRASKKNRRDGNRGRKSMTNPALRHRMTIKDEKTPIIPEVLDEDTVRVIPMSGVEQIGRNMTIVETKDDIIIFDIGFQFISPESNAPGADYILPNTQYLEERKHKIKGLVITHGHLDHIGGIPFVMERIGNAFAQRTLTRGRHADQKNIFHK